MDRSLTTDQPQSPAARDGHQAVDDGHRDAVRCGGRGVVAGAGHSAVSGDSRGVAAGARRYALGRAGLDSVAGAGRDAVNGDDCGVVAVPGRGVVEVSGRNASAGPGRDTVVGGSRGILDGAGADAVAGTSRGAVAGADRGVAEGAGRGVMADAGRGVRAVGGLDVLVGAGVDTVAGCGRDVAADPARGDVAGGGRGVAAGASGEAVARAPLGNSAGAGRGGLVRAGRGFVALAGRDAQARAGLEAVADGGRGVVARADADAVTDGGSGFVTGADPDPGPGAGGQPGAECSTLGITPAPKEAKRKRGGRRPGAGAKTRAYKQAHAAGQQRLSLHGSSLSVLPRPGPSGGLEGVGGGIRAQDATNAVAHAPGGDAPDRPQRDDEEEISPAVSREAAAELDALVDRDEPADGDAVRQDHVGDGESGSEADDDTDWEKDGDQFDIAVDVREPSTSKENAETRAGDGQRRRPRSNDCSAGTDGPAAHDAAASGAVGGGGRARPAARKRTSKALSPATVAFLRQIKESLVSDPAYVSKLTNFVIHPPDPVATAGPLDADAYYVPRVMVYAPFDVKSSYRLHCPTCGSANVVMDGYTDFRRVVDLDDCLFVIGRRYRCKHTHKNNCFAAWDKKLLRGAPPYVREAFPVILTHRLGVTKQLFDLLRTMYEGGRGVGPFADLVRENHRRAHHRKELAFLSRLADHVCPPVAGDQTQLTQNYDPNKLPRFSTFADPAGYNGCCGSRSFYRSVYTASMEELEPLMKARSALLSARILSGDHFFKILRCNFTFHGRRLFMAAYSLVNENTEVMATLLTQSKSLEELRQMLEGVQRRMIALGLPPLQVEVFFTDNPTAEASFLEGIFPGLDKADATVINVCGAHNEAAASSGAAAAAGPAAPAESPAAPAGVHAAAAAAPNVPAAGLAAPLASASAPVASATPVGRGRHAGRRGRRPLPLLELPSDHTITYLTSLEEAMAAVDLFRRDLDLSRGAAVIGMDAEWSLDGLPFGRQPSKLQVLQLSSSKETLVLHLSRMRGVPHQLKSLLADAAVYKVGKNVGGDVAKLKRDYGVLTQRYLELGALASRRQLVPSGSISLVGLTRAVLQKDLDKTEAVRLSTWSQVLRAEQLQYAALDSYAGLAVYNKIQEMGSPTPLPTATCAGMRVAVTDATGLRRVARCTVVRNQKEKVGSFLVGPKNRIMLQVDEVLLPAFRLPFVGPREPKTLREFVQDAEGRGVAPVIVVSRDNIRDCNHPAELRRCEDAADGAEPSLALEAHDAAYDALEGLAVSSAAMCSSGVVGGGGAADGSDDESSASEGENDEEADYLDGDECTDNTFRGLRSGVRGDIMHAMDRVLKKVSKRHGATALFARSFAAALMLYNQSDTEAVKKAAAVQFPDLPWEQVLFRQPEWVHRRVRRVVPQPDALVPRLKEVFKRFGPIMDASTNQPLFNKAARKAAKQVLGLAAAGWLSDPSGVGMYVFRRRDRHYLPLWLCCRGTNSNEGSVHQKLVKTFQSMKGASAEIIHYALLEWVHRTNVRAAHQNRGWPFYGHYDVWIVDDIVQLQERVYGRRVSFLMHSCAADYDLPEFMCGVTPMATADVQECGLPTGDLKQSIQPVLDVLSRQKRWLSKKMGTVLPILPVHTKQEKVLFFEVQRTLKRRLGRKPGDVEAAVEYNGLVAEHWQELVRKAVRTDDGKVKHMSQPHLFFKTPSHIMMYQKFYDRSENSTSTLALSHPGQQRKDITGAIVRYTNFGDDAGALNPIHGPDPAPPVLEDTPAAVEAGSAPSSGVDGSTSSPAPSASPPTAAASVALPRPSGSVSARAGLPPLAPAPCRSQSTAPVHRAPAQALRSFSSNSPSTCSARPATTAPDLHTLAAQLLPSLGAVLIQHLSDTGAAAVGLNGAAPTRAPPLPSSSHPTGGVPIAAGAINAALPANPSAGAQAPRASTAHGPGASLAYSAIAASALAGPVPPAATSGVAKKRRQQRHCAICLQRTCPGNSRRKSCPQYARQSEDSAAAGDGAASGTVGGSRASGLSSVEREDGQGPVPQVTLEAQRERTTTARPSATRGLPSCATTSPSASTTSPRTNEARPPQSCRKRTRSPTP